MTKAVEDKATVKIYYENRIIKLAVDEEVLLFDQHVVLFFERGVFGAKTRDGVAQRLVFGLVFFGKLD